MRKRSEAFLEELIADAAQDAPGRDKEEMVALVVSHGGLLNVMMVGVMGLGEGVGFMTNCGVTIVKVFKEDGGDTSVSYEAQTVNDDKHLIQTGLKTGSDVESFVRRKKEAAAERNGGACEASTCLSHA